MSAFRKIVCALLAVLAGCLLSARRGAAQETHPVVDLNEGCLVGGVAGREWLGGEALAPLLKGGERYRLYTLTTARARVVRSNAAPAEEVCNGTMNVRFPSDVQDGIAVSGDWNALPRVPRMISTRDPAYRQAVARILRRHGFANPRINVTQVLRVDLDGDGIEEALVSATHLAEGLSVNGGPMAVHARPGDYSLVFVRKIVRGRVRDIILSEGYFPRRNSEQWTPTQDIVAAVLDLNGDGRMEIILHGGYYEGSWSTVFRLDGDRVENVFGCGCGA
ncbi:MAG TPA: hypothetical protein VJT09_13635 [Pyrinomonadaceae bacterium]|nr:hypothetical protein [Pyrinomonadaceae bacterium]